MIDIHPFEIFPDYFRDDISPEAYGLPQKTERNARVMVNGAEVPYIGNDGSFQFFTPPLPNGENIITVTAQNAKGGVRTRQQKVVIQ